MVRAASLQKYVTVGFIAVLLLALLGGTALAADEGTKQVGLVVAFPDGTEHREVVTVAANASTFDVLKAARLDLASQVTDFGPAICGINKFGCPATNCFCDSARFWAYYHLNTATNTWEPALQGVGAYIPAAGSVEGFVWSGMDANFQPTEQPKVYAFQELSAGSPATLPTTGRMLFPVPLGLGLALIAAGLIVRVARDRRAAGI